jgi:hypothetical protein
LCVDLDGDVDFVGELVFDVELVLAGVTVLFVCEVLCGFLSAANLALEVFAADAGDAQ